MSHVRVSRRGFVAGAAAALAAPMIIPRHVLGDDNNAPANEKIVLGCVGIGKMMYGSHLPHYVKMPEVKVVAVCDVDTTRRETGKKRVDDEYENADCAAYVDYRELLARDDIDAVACATPDHWHAMVILDACKAGKDVYCEKPLTHNLMEAKAVMDAVRRLEHHLPDRQPAAFGSRVPLRLRTGPQRPHRQDQAGLRRRRRARPSRATCPKQEMEPGLDWDLWLGPAPMRPYNSVLSPRGMHNHFPVWRNLPRVRRRRHDRLGRPPLRHRPVGPRHGRVRPVEIIPPDDPKRGRA